MRSNIKFVFSLSFKWAAWDLDNFSSYRHQLNFSLPETFDLGHSKIRILWHVNLQLWKNITIERKLLFVVFFLSVEYLFEAKGNSTFFCWQTKKGSTCQSELICFINKLTVERCIAHSAGTKRDFASELRCWIIFLKADFFDIVRKRTLWPGT